MTTPHDRLRDTLRSIHDKLTHAEASAIVDVSRLAAMADGHTNIDEMLVLTSIAKVVYEMAEVTDLPIPTGKVDEKRLLDIGEQLVPTPARELAYSCAFLVMVQDLDVTKEERELTNKLADALLIDHARATTLASNIEAFVRTVRA